MLLEVAAVEQTDLGEEHGRDEGHLGELLETALHLELVALFLGHERHDAAHIGPTVTGQDRTTADPSQLTLSASLTSTSLHMCVLQRTCK